MTSKKYLSEKKITTQNISISPALKEWVERYVSVMKDKNPDDERYKSVSAFYCSVMASVLKEFEKGKTLDDFEKVQIPEIRAYTERFEAKFFVPFIEPALKADKYMEFDPDENSLYFSALRSVFSHNLAPYNYDAVKLFFNELRKQYITSGLNKDMRLDLFTDECKKFPTGIIEHTGVHDNIHWVNCKMMLQGTGALGFKVNNLLYIDKERYYRIDLEATDLVFNKESVTKLSKERKTLLRQNAEFLINYYRIINDLDYYLWMKMAQDDDLIVDFKNLNAKDRWIKKIEEDSQKYGTNEEFLLCMLKFFERMHWIKIESEQKLSFRIVLSGEKHEEDTKILLDYLSEHAKLSDENGIFYLYRK